MSVIRNAYTSNRAGRARPGLLATTGLAALMIAALTVHPGAALAATTVTATGSTPVNVTSTGVTATGSDAIHTSAVDGNTLITINGGNIRSNTNGFAGINSSASGLGNLTIVINTGTVGHTGTSVTGPGIVLNQTGTGSNFITNNATIVGVGTLAYPVIAIATTNAGSTTITNNASGTIRATDTTGNATGMGMAILSTVATGANNIVNAGTLIGEISLSNQTNSLNNSGTWDVQDNSAAGSYAAVFGTSGLNTLTNSGTINAGNFSAAATSTFTGIQTLNNTGTINAGLFGAGDVTNFIAGGTTTQTVTNAGTIIVNGTANFEGDANFYNAGGLIDMRIFDYTTVNRATTDVTALNVAVSGNTYTPGVAYNFIGGAGSELGLDTSIGALPSIGSNVPSDRLLISGSATGTTGILINDTGAGASYNPVGITLVGVNGASTNAFYLQSVSANDILQPALGPILEPALGPMGAIKDGFWFFPLLQSSHAVAVADGLTGADSTEYRLYGLPDVEAFQTPLAVTGSEDIWYDTVLGWNQRQDRLRKHWQGVYGAAEAYADGKFNFWMKAAGNWDSRTSSSSVDPYAPAPGLFGNFDTGFKQNTYSVQVGTDVDFNHILGNDGVLVLDASIGLIDSMLKLKSTSNEFDYSGVTIAAAADYLRGGFFWDTTLTADVLQATLNYNSLAYFGDNQQSVEADTWGVLSSAGYHIGFGGHNASSGAYLEPLLTIAYTSTTVGSFTALGTTATFNDSDTVRGAFGAKLGGQLSDRNGVILDASITGNYWNEFTNDTSVTFPAVAPASPLTLSDVRDKGYGEVTGQVNFADSNTGWSGFVDSGAKFNSQYTSIEVSGGVAYKW